MVMKVILRKVLRTVPGYQFARRRYRSLTEQDFRDRESLRRWITTGTRLQQRLHLEPIIFQQGRAFARSRDGIEYWWNADLDGGILGLEFGTDFEKHELECVLSFIEAVPDNEAVFLDIGGNCGVYSLNVARRFPGAHSYCFEPVPTSQAMIRVNAEHNGFADRVTLVGAALGDEVRTVRMTASYSAMDHLVVGNVAEELSPLVIEVSMTTLDNFVAERALPRVDFIKCDVEGAELLVFKGGRTVLANLHPPIMLEIEARHTKRFGYSPEELDEFLRTFGYEVCLPGPIAEVERLPDLGSGIARGFNNFLYLHQGSA